jgi:hypothetical protein
MNSSVRSNRTDESDVDSGQITEEDQSDEDSQSQDHSVHDEDDHENEQTHSIVGEHENDIDNETETNVFEGSPKMSEEVKHHRKASI